MPDSTLSNSTEQPEPVQQKPLFRILKDCYGMKAGQIRSDVSIHRHGVLPEFLIGRGLAERATDGVGEHPDHGSQGTGSEAGSETGQADSLVGDQ